MIRHISDGIALTKEEELGMLKQAGISDENISRYESRVYPQNRVDLFLNKWPELKELYNYDPIIHVGLDALAHAQNDWQLTEIAKHILVNYSTANAQLCKAIEQGFNPQQK